MALLPMGLLAQEGVGRGAFVDEVRGALLDEGHLARSCGDLATRCRHLGEHAQACSPKIFRRSCKLAGLRPSFLALLPMGLAAQEEVGARGL